MNYAIFSTPIGLLHAVSNEKALVELSFDAPSLELSDSPLLRAFGKELEAYFTGALKTFTTRLDPIGTPFQVQVWKALQKIPYGKTISYKQLAESIGRPTAFRAVARANGANPLPIVIPCHRVIQADGGLGGYNCGLERKEWLLKKEKR